MVGLSAMIMPVVRLATVMIVLALMLMTALFFGKIIIYFMLCISRTPGSCLAGMLTKDTSLTLRTPYTHSKAPHLLKSINSRAQLIKGSHMKPFLFCQRQIKGVFGTAPDPKKKLNSKFF